MGTAKLADRTITSIRFKWKTLTKTREAMVTVRIPKMSKQKEEEPWPIRKGKRSPHLLRNRPKRRGEDRSSIQSSVCVTAYDLTLVII
jgi:hypothetical protein